jgi:hypothetical protein
MPRASWRGFLRLSLVSCPIYLSPATSRTKSIRLHQVWQPRPIEEPEDELPDQGQQQEITGASRPAAPMMTPALPKIKAARQHGSRSALTILAPAKKSRRRRSSRATNTNAANSSRSRRMN